MRALCWCAAHCHVFGPGARFPYAPGRVLWGTDFPHPNAKVMPNDGELVDLFAAVCPDEALRRKVLIDNPTRLYWA